MKIVLIKDVKGVGHAHETVEIADGHALNFLIPKKLAVPATPTAIKEAQNRRKHVVERKELDTKLIEQNLASLAEARIVLTVKANEKGHLYDAVGASDLSVAVKEQAGVDLPESAIKIEKPIKELGTFTIPVSFGELFGKFSVIVEAE